MFIKTNKKQRREILAVAYIVAVIQPLMVLPQIIEIFSHHSAHDVSLTTWIMLLIFNISNFIYALVFNIKPIIINNAIWIVVEIILVIGILIY
ncbi:MAG TPA: PQ-loop domain-containing transporter [Candidatus Saccharimonadales bacterium]